MIKIELSQSEMQSLAGLIVAGAKSPTTGAEGVVQAADLLKKLQAAMDANVKADAPPTLEAVAS